MITNRIRIVVAISVGVLLLAGVGVFWWTSTSRGPWKSGDEIGESAREGGDRDGDPGSLTSRHDGDGSVDGDRLDAVGSDVRGPMYYGVAQPVRADANAYVRSVAEGARKGSRRPERLSPFIAPKPFDPAAYKADPKKYLTTVEPGRVFQAAQPGGDTARLRVKGRTFHRIRQGESSPLRVVGAPPGSPVTLTSFDMGAFGSGLPSITKQADNRGVAEAVFRAIPGTRGNVNILASCPLASDQVRFVVYVLVSAASQAAH